MEIMTKLLIWKLLSQSFRQCIPGYQPVPLHQFACTSFYLVLTCTHWPLFYMDYRLPVIQSLEADVRQTTQSLLAQILQRLRSNIQVRLKFQKWTFFHKKPQRHCGLSALCLLHTITELIGFMLSPTIVLLLVYCFECCVLIPQLPECLRVIGYLRRLAVFNEQEIRLQVQSALTGFHL